MGSEWSKGVKVKLSLSIDVKSRRNFNWIRSVKSEIVSEYCLFNESITLNQVLQIRYFLGCNFSPPPEKFIYLEIFYSLKIQPMHIMSQSSLCVCVCVCVCVDILHWALTHLSKLTPLIISSSPFLVYQVKIDDSFCTSTVSFRNVDDSSSNKCLNYLFWGLSLSPHRGSWRQELCLLISVPSLSSTASSTRKTHFLIHLKKK